MNTEFDVEHENMNDSWRYEYWILCRTWEHDWQLKIWILNSMYNLRTWLTAEDMNTEFYVQLDQHLKSEFYVEFDQHLNSEFYVELDQHLNSEFYVELDQHLNSEFYVELDQHLNSEFYVELEWHKKINDQHDHDIIGQKNCN
jgi:hypothetical protein